MVAATIVPRSGGWFARTAGSAGVRFEGRPDDLPRYRGRMDMRRWRKLMPASVRMEAPMTVREWFWLVVVLAVVGYGVYRALPILVQLVGSG